MFRIGQKVVCVDGGKPQANVTYGWEELPVKGHTYTIRGHCQQKGVLLEEVVNQAATYRAGVHECHFNPSRFRPVVEKKTDISIFKEILRRETVDGRAPVRLAND